MWTFTTLIPLMSLLSLVLADDKPCTVREGGQYFDLSKLSAQCVDDPDQAEEAYILKPA
jgi:hypothetical protein